MLTDDFVIVEPASLPHGGEHHGIDGYVALMQRRLPMLELLSTRGPRVARSEVFVFDTAALVALLPEAAPGALCTILRVPGP